MGPRVTLVSNPFRAISPNKVVETETETTRLLDFVVAGYG